MRFLRAIGGAFVTVWLVLTIVFAMVRLSPGGPFEGERAMTAEQKAVLQKAYGLDRPIFEQYAIFITNLVRGNLGESIVIEGQSVSGIIARTFPVSLGVGTLALFWAIVGGVPLGFYWSIKEKKQYLVKVDISKSIFLLSMLPSFVAAPILQQIVLNFGGVAYGYNGFASLFWPSISLGVYYLPLIARLTQAGFDEEKKSLYLRVAQAKGLQRNKAFWKHSYRAALSPLLAYLAPTAAGLITGAFVVETVWGLPGLGRFFVNAIFNRDDTLLLGLVAFYTVLLVGMNTAAELILMKWNPSSKLNEARKERRRDALGGN